MVVLTSLCPRNSCTVRMSYPFSSKCVANECWNVWQLPGPNHSRTADAQRSLPLAVHLRPHGDGRRTRARGSTEIRDDGNTNCDVQDRAVFRYRRTQGVGQLHLPKPVLEILLTCVFTFARCRLNGPTNYRVSLYHLCAFYCYVWLNPCVYPKSTSFTRKRRHRSKK